MCDEQAAELRRAEEQLQQLESALVGRNGAAASLQARVAELESELDGARAEQRTFDSVRAAKERDQARRLEGAQDEVRPPSFGQGRYWAIAYNALLSPCPMFWARC